MGHERRNQGASPAVLAALGKTFPDASKEEQGGWDEEIVGPMLGISAFGAGRPSGHRGPLHFNPDVLGGRVTIAPQANPTDALGGAGLGLPPQTNLVQQQSNDAVPDPGTHFAKHPHPDAPGLGTSQLIQNPQTGEIRQVFIQADGTTVWGPRAFANPGDLPEAGFHSAAGVTPTGTEPGSTKAHPRTYTWGGVPSHQQDIVDFHNAIDKGIKDQDINHQGKHARTTGLEHGMDNPVWMGKQNHPGGFGYVDWQNLSQPGVYDEHFGGPFENQGAAFDEKMGPFKYTGSRIAHLQDTFADASGEPFNQIPDYGNRPADHIWHDSDTTFGRPPRGPNDPSGGFGAEGGGSYSPYSGFLDRGEKASIIAGTDTHGLSIDDHMHLLRQMAEGPGGIHGSPAGQKPVANRGRGWTTDDLELVFQRLQTQLARERITGNYNGVGQAEFEKLAGELRDILPRAQEALHGTNSLPIAEGVPFAGGFDYDALRKLRIEYEGTVHAQKIKSGQWTDDAGQIFLGEGQGILGPRHGGYDSSNLLSRPNVDDLLRQNPNLRVEGQMDLFPNRAPGESGSFHGEGVHPALTEAERAAANALGENFLRNVSADDLAHLVNTERITSTTANEIAKLMRKVKTRGGLEGRAIQNTGGAAKNLPRVNMQSDLHNFGPTGMMDDIRTGYQHEGATFNEKTNRWEIKDKSGKVKSGVRSGNPVVRAANSRILNNRFVRQLHPRAGIFPSMLAWEAVAGFAGPSEFLGLNTDEKISQWQGKFADRLAPAIKAYADQRPDKIDLAGTSPDEGSSLELTNDAAGQLLAAMAMLQHRGSYNQKQLQQVFEELIQVGGQGTQPMSNKELTEYFMANFNERKRHKGEYVPLIGAQWNPDTEGQWGLFGNDPGPGKRRGGLANWINDELYGGGSAVNIPTESANDLHRWVREYAAPTGVVFDFALQAPVQPLFTLFTGRLGGQIGDVTMGDSHGGFMNNYSVELEKENQRRLSAGVRMGNISRDATATADRHAQQLADTKRAFAEYFKGKPGWTDEAIEYVASKMTINQKTPGMDDWSKNPRIHYGQRSKGRQDLPFHIKGKPLAWPMTWSKDIAGESTVFPKKGWTEVTAPDLQWDQTLQDTSGYGGADTENRTTSAYAGPSDPSGGQEGNEGSIMDPRSKTSKDFAEWKQNMITQQLGDQSRIRQLSQATAAYDAAMARHGAPNPPFSKEVYDGMQAELAQARAFHAAVRGKYTAGEGYSGGAQPTEFSWNTDSASGEFDRNTPGAGGYAFTDIDGDGVGDEIQAPGNLTTVRDNRVDSKERAYVDRLYDIGEDGIQGNFDEGEGDGVLSPAELRNRQLNLGWSGPHSFERSFESANTDHTYGRPKVTFPEIYGEKQFPSYQYQPPQVDVQSVHNAINYMVGGLQGRSTPGSLQPDTELILQDAEKAGHGETPTGERGINLQKTFPQQGTMYEDAKKFDLDGDGFLNMEELTRMTGTRNPPIQRQP